MHVAAGCTVGVVEVTSGHSLILRLVGMRLSCDVSSLTERQASVTCFFCNNCGST